MGIATTLWLVLWLPSLRGWLEGSMLRHMILQLPILVLVGSARDEAFEQNGG